MTAVLTLVGIAAPATANRGPFDVYPGRVPRASNSDLRLAAVTWLLPAIVVLGALGLILLNWEWSGLCAGVPV